MFVTLFEAIVYLSSYGLTYTDTLEWGVYDVFRVSEMILHECAPNELTGNMFLRLQ